MIVSLDNCNQISLLTGKIPKFETIQSSLIKLIDESDDVQKRKTNLQCKMTGWKMHEQHKCFQTIADAVVDHVHYYQRKHHKSSHKITVTDCWGAVYHQDDEAREHSHYPALWSGVAYIKCNQNSNATEFPSCDYRHRPVEGEYVIFPGWLKHYVKPGSDSRYVCAFNMRALDVI